MSYLLGGLDLVVNNQTINVVSTIATTVNGDIAPSEKLVVVGNAYNRFTRPDNAPAATIKSINTSASLTGLTAAAVGTTSVPIATSFNNKLNGTLNLTYDGEYYVKLLLGTASTSTTISDSSNNLYSIVSSNVTANALNPFGSGSTYNSLLFNGTSSYLTINNPISSFLGSEDFTIEFFINPTNFTGGPVIIDTGTNLGFQYWQVSLTATGTVQFIYTYGTSTTTTVVTTSTLTAATWSHVAIVRNNTVQTPGNNFNIYINGVSGVSALIANKWGDVSTVASSISIGKKLNNTLYFNGYLSNIRITQAAVYTGAFTKPSATLAVTQSAGVNIALIPAGRKLNTKSSTTTTKPANYEPTQFNLYSKLSYNSSFGQIEVYDPDVYAKFRVDSILAPTANINVRADIEPMNVGLAPEFTINGSDKPNISGTSSVSNITTVGGASFSIGKTLSVAANDAFNYGTGDFTQECWFFFPADSPANSAVELFRTGRFSVGSFTIGQTYCSVSTNGLTTFAYATGPSAYGGSGTIATIPLGSWNHLASVRIGTNITQYLNGVAVNSFVVSGVQTVGLNSDATIIGGGCPAGLSVYISNARIVKGMGIYTGNFPVSKADLTTTGPAVGGSVLAIPPSQVSLLTLKGNTIVDSSPNNFTITNTGSVTFAPGASSYSLVDLSPVYGPPAYVSTPSANETLIEYVTNSTNPNLVNKRVKNLISGTTGVIEELQSWS